jgi:hypothetical protein
MKLLLDASFEPGTSWLKIFNQEATMETSEKIWNCILHNSYIQKIYVEYFSYTKQLLCSVKINN